MSVHQNIHVNCTMDEPLQVLVDKLSTKSTELYIFWQNYNQMYHQLNQKNIEIQTLRQEINTMMRDRSLSKSQLPPQQVNVPQPLHQTIIQENPQLKNKLIIAEKSNQSFKIEIDRLHSQTLQLKRQNSRHSEQNLQLQALLQQLRDENNLQKNTLESILRQLNQAQKDLTSMDQMTEEISHKQTVINRYVDREKELESCLANREDQIDQLVKDAREMKTKYEVLIRESMQNARNKVIESLPALLKNSKQHSQLLITN